MENIITIIIICILLIVSMVLLFYINVDDKEYAFAKAYFSWICLAVSFGMILGYIEKQPIESSEPFKIDIIINTKVIDDIEIERDTLYILTRPTK